MDVPQFVDVFFSEAPLGFAVQAVLEGWSCQSWGSLWSCWPIVVQLCPALPSIAEKRLGEEVGTGICLVSLHLSLGIPIS